HCPRSSLVRPHVSWSTATASTGISVLSLHDALPICSARARRQGARRGGEGPARPGRDRRAEGAREARVVAEGVGRPGCRAPRGGDRKSTRLNSSHDQISHAVFGLKKKRAGGVDDLAG